MKKLSERLKWAREEKKLSQQQLANLCGLSQAAIGNMESGTREASGKITTIAKALEVDAHWLAEGVGSPLLRTSPEWTAAQAAASAEASTQSIARRVDWVADDEAILLSEYRAADNEGRHAIMQTAQLVEKILQDKLRRNKPKTKTLEDGPNN